MSSSSLSLASASTHTATATVSLFAPGVDQMLHNIEKAMTKLDGDVSIGFRPTPLATTTAPDGAVATVWNVRAHESASINGHTTSIVQDEKFLESHNYFSAIDNSGAEIECHFKHIGAEAVCVRKARKHHKTVTTTYKHANAFATAYHKHVVKPKVSSSSTQTTSSASVAVAAAVQTTSSAATANDGGAVQVQSGQVDSSSSSTAGSNTRMNSTSGAKAGRSKIQGLPILLTAASVLFTAVIAFQP